MGLPKVLVVSAANSNAGEHLVSELTGTDLPVSDVAKDQTCSYRIDTKYYEADIEFHLTDTSRQIDAGAAEVLLLVFNAEKHASFENLTSWFKRLEDVPEVVACVASDANFGEDETHSASDAVHEWCLDAGVELVELQETAEQPEEDRWQEKHGVDRVIELLHTTMWPNMVLKGDHKPTLNLDEDDLSGFDLPSFSLPLSYSPSAPPSHTTPSEAIPAELSTLLGKMDMDNGLEELESFEDTLRTFSQLREQSLALPDRQRRDFAASIALAFLDQLGADDQRHEEDSGEEEEEEKTEVTRET